jgi:hypothetical protein
MALIYTSYQGYKCKLDLGRYATLRWNIFLLGEDDDCISFSKNEELGIAQKSEIKLLTSVDHTNGFANLNSVGPSTQEMSPECVLSKLKGRDCKLQTKGTLLDMDGVRKINLIDVKPGAIIVRVKRTEQIIGMDHIVYLMED